MTKILLLEDINKIAEENFKINNFNEIISLKSAKNEEELLEIIEEIDIIGIRAKTKLTKKVLEKAKNLKVIGCFCIGTEQVDIKTASEKGIKVFNSPFANTRSVAEIIICEIISLLRKLPEKNKACHEGKWSKDSLNCFEVRGKTLGIIGYGNIGIQLSILAEAIGMKVIFYDLKSNKLAIGNSKQVSSMEELLKNSDVVSVNIPGSKDGKFAIDTNEVAQMKKNSILINFARGNSVNVNAVAVALENKHLGGAGFDVFLEEPSSKDDKLNCILQKYENVILTPHIGASTEEAQKMIGDEVSKKLINFILKGDLEDCVNK